MNEEQKAQLKLLTNHPGWKIVKEIEENAEKALGIQMLNVDLSNETHLKILKENQIYSKARKDFIVNIEKQNLEVYENLERLF